MVPTYTIDFETYYDKDYSLTKLSTEEYVRSDKFEIIGVSIMEAGVDAEPEWFSFGGDRNHSRASYRSALIKLHGANVIAHNAMFDVAILEWVLGIRVNRVLDTLGMAKCLHGTQVGGSLAALAEHYGVGSKGTEVQSAIGMHRSDFSAKKLQRYGEYCKQDVKLTWRIATCMVPLFPQEELSLIDTTVKMFTRPKIVLHKETLQDHLQTTISNKNQLLAQVVADETELRSNKKFAALLEGLGVTPPMKISPTTGEETYAFAKTDEEFQKLHEHHDERVRVLVDARLGVKTSIEESRTERFLAIAERGPLPIPLNYYGAHTGRWSGRDKINMQNLPRGSALKKAMYAPDGMVFLDCDLSQIEARMLAYLAGQDDLVEAFRAGEDVYKEMAASIYGCSVDEVTKAQRRLGKMTILGAGYGMGAPRFRDQVRAQAGVLVSEAEAELAIRTYRERFPKIVEFWKSMQEALGFMYNNQDRDVNEVMYGDARELVAVHSDGYIVMPNGLKLAYPNITCTYVENRREYTYKVRRHRAMVETKLYGAKLVENICQAYARNVIGHHIVQLSKQLPPDSIVLTVHDAIGAVVSTAVADAAFEKMLDTMSTAPAWCADLPLACEGFMATSYGACNENDCLRHGVR